ncbi:probable E3 ubiquitin-protein ligase BAH1-like 1 [Typha angustifolia]|uniref:probable E3 ubiquitin-protein ligase BAH1-like 1 n=1 Tax=Typha angustifolia TaxID=59011 RepID=UPI003C2C3011
MKFGETFTEYLHGEQERFLNKCSHLEYKRLKKVLKSCRICRALQDNSGSDQQDESNASPDFCQCDSCPLCDQIFFAELTREASDIAGCFSSRVRRLLHLHVSSGMQRYMWRLRHCFTDDQQVMIQEGRMLLDYVTMNAIAIRKILKKYDKIHGSVNGREFKTKLRAKHIELLQSPWLIELGAFYLNFNGSDGGEPGEFFRKFSCDLNDDQPAMTMSISDTLKYEYSLNCAVCLDTLFNPYALSCGHLFCKSCACSSASVLLFQGLKTASQGAKCPICRAVGVYNDAVQMTELDLLLKNRCKDYWKERLRSERAEMVKQSKEYWQSQAILTLGL